MHIHVIKHDLPHYTITPQHLCIKACSCDSSKYKP